jgi:hypothetical protein
MKISIATAKNPLAAACKRPLPVKFAEMSGSRTGNQSITSGQHSDSFAFSPKRRMRLS